MRETVSSESPYSNILFCCMAMCGLRKPSLHLSAKLLPSTCSKLLKNLLCRDGLQGCLSTTHTVAAPR